MRNDAVTLDQLEIKEWPLKEAGSIFFGYIVSMGLIPTKAGDHGEIKYVDFFYNDEFERYKLPDNQGLVFQLTQHLSANLAELCVTDTYHTKLWIDLMEDGTYKSDMP